jgi:hypothetical protein
MTGFSESIPETRRVEKGSLDSPASQSCMTGVGFTEQNLRSFFTAYSLNKPKRGSKGIDRFTFLTVFENIEIYVLALA